MTDKPLQLGNINLTKMSGSIQINVIPDQYTLCFDCRIKSDADIVRQTSKENDDEVKINYLTNEETLN